MKYSFESDWKTYVRMIDWLANRPFENVQLETVNGKSNSLVVTIDFPNSKLYHWFLKYWSFSLPKNEFEKTMIHFSLSNYHRFSVINGLLIVNENNDDYYRSLETYNSLRHLLYDTNNRHIIGISHENLRFRNLINLFPDCLIYTIKIQSSDKETLIFIACKSFDDVMKIKMILPPNYNTLEYIELT